MKTFKHTALFVLLCSFLLAGCQIDWDDIFDRDEKHIVKSKILPVLGSQEVPPRTTSGVGTIELTYNKKTKMLTYQLTWAGLTGNPIGSHFHGPAPRGANAGIRHDFTPLLPKTTSGTFTNSVTVDNVTIKEDSLLMGFYYVNIHTPMFPGGEIRGQLEFN